MSEFEMWERVYYKCVKSCGYSVIVSFPMGKKNIKMSI